MTTKQKSNPTSNSMPADLLLLETKKLSINSGMRISEKNIAEALGDPLILINKEIEEQKKYLQFVESDKDYLQKREVFLHKLGGVKQGCRKTGDREECVELQHEFLELAKEYRYDKDIIKKLFSMQYHSYDSRSNYVGVSTYSYDYKHNVVNHLPDILYHDKDFVLELIAILGTSNVIGPIKNRYGENYSLWKDKDFIIKVLNSDNDGHEKIGLDVLDHVVEDEDIIELYYSKKGGYGWHEQPEKYKNSDRFLLAAFKKSGLEGFYTFDNKFRRENPDYYDNLKKRIQGLLTGDKEKIVKIIETNVLSLKGTDIKKFIPEINQELLKDDNFICKLLRLDEKLVTFCGEKGRYILNFIKLTKANGSHDSINWGSVSFGSEGTISYIQGTSRYSGTGGSEYGNYIAVYYQGSIEKQHFVYRDAYDPKKDDRSYDFRNSSILEVKEKGGIIEVRVTGSSDKRTKEVSFNFTKKNTNTTLPDSKQIDEWQNKFIKEKGALITGKQEEHKKLGQKMPFYCSIAQYQGMSGDDIYYDQPTIVSEYFDPITGMGTIVVKTQIDHSAGAHKMQRARDCLIWTKEQKRSSAGRECRRHNEIEAGNGVAMNAESILKGYQKSSKK